MGFECRPPTDMPSTRPLPGAEAPFGPALPHASSCSALVVSHHLDGFLRAEVAGLLHPATGQGFAAFRACRPPAPPESDAFVPGSLPATRFTPFEDFPSPAAVPHHCGRCLPAVTVLPGCSSRPKPDSLPTVDRRSGRRTSEVPARVTGGPAPRGGVAGSPRWPCLARDRAPCHRSGRSPCPGPGALAPRSPAIRGVEVGTSLPDREPGAVPPKRSVSFSRQSPAPCHRGGRSPDSAGTGRRASEEVGLPVPVVPGARAPKSRVSRCHEASSRCSEERRLPCPKGRGSIPSRERRSAPRGGPLTCPVGSGGLRDRGRATEVVGLPAANRGGVPVLRGARFPAPLRCRAHDSPEGGRLLDAGEVVRAALRRVPLDVPRGPCCLSREFSTRADPKPGAVPPRWSVSLSRSRWGAGGSEELLVPCPGEAVRGGSPRGAVRRAPVEVVRAVLRRVPFAVPRWNLTGGSPRGAVCPVPLAGPCPSRAGDGCARKRSRCDDAPIRRSGPPRHRAHGAPGGRSSRRHPVKSPSVAGAEAPTPRRAIEPPRGLAQSPTVAPEPCRPPEGSRPGTAAEAAESPSRCACTHRGGPTSEPVETSRSSRLQGFAPLTSPS